MLHLGKRYCVQEEKGEAGEVRHLQGWIHFHKKTRPLEATGLTVVHWEKQKAKKDSDAWDYCRKDATRLPGGQRWAKAIPRTLDIWEYEELRPWQQKIFDQLGGFPPKTDRKILWWWEPTGRVGKSILTKCLVDTGRALVVSGKKNDCFNALLTWLTNNGQGPDIVIFDIPRVSMDFISYESIEKIKDGCFYSGKYEGGMCRYNIPHVVVFANCEPAYEKLSADRWVVKELVGLGGTGS